MKKLEKQEWEERREYLKETILPSMLEIMKDFFGNEKLYLGMNTQKNGEFITAFSYVSDKNGKATDCVFCTCLFTTVLKKSIEITTSLQNFSRSTQPEKRGSFISLYYKPKM